MLESIGHHRASDFDRLVLPNCLSFVQAIGHRMAYDAAVSAGVDPRLIGLYEASCVKLDLSWYVERLGLSRMRQCEMEVAAIDRVSPRTEEFLSLMVVEPYIMAYHIIPLLLSRTPFKTLMIPSRITISIDS